MAAKGYCSVAQVEAHLGLSFTGAQMADCEEKIEAAETHLDEETGRGWLVGVQADEQHRAPFADDAVWLRYAPVGTVESVTARYGQGGPEVLLTDGEDYELVDAGAGKLKLLSPAGIDRVLVSYTPVNEVPADVRQATVELVASWMQPSLQPGSFGLDSYSLPDLTVRFARSHVQAVAPPLVERVIARYRWIPVS